MFQGSDKTGRLGTGPSVRRRGQGQAVHKQGDHTLVQTPRATAGGGEIRTGHRHLEYWVNFDALYPLTAD